MHDGVCVVAVNGHCSTADACVTVGCTSVVEATLSRSTVIIDNTVSGECG